MSSARALPPPSSSSFILNLVGGLFYLLSIPVALYFAPDIGVLEMCLVSITAALIPIVAGELFILKVHQRKEVGLKAPKKDWPRLRTKLVGYYASLALVALFYTLIPEYEGAFYGASFQLLIVVAFIFVIGGWIYFSELDPRMKAPKDEYWEMGNLALGRWSQVDRGKIFKHLKSLLLRAYFLPVMLSYFAVFVSEMMSGHEALVESYLGHLGDAPGLVILKFVVLVYFALSAMDVLFASIGYLMAFKGMDAHIRSTEPTILGWVVCIVCYYPFWELMMISVFFSELYNGPVWHDWFGHISWTVVVWGTLVVVAQCAEALVTLTFGIRFSNLTYRGLISTGPFRLMRHPQYVFKMCNRFFFFVPFLSLMGFAGAAKTMVMFAGVCFVYFLRARTEENHLSRYPEYVAYAKWVERHGIFRRLYPILPFLSYCEKRAKSGRIF